jgi:hypothetical protein
MARARKYYLKNNYLTLRSCTLWSCTHIPNIFDLTGKTKKKVMVRTSFAEKKQKQKKKSD